jgi:large subunit ribosomal protein L9
MKVILLENVKRVGSIGEVIDVKRGYARNFLIANKKALYASKENISEVEKIKSDLSKKDNEKKKEAFKFQNKLMAKNIQLKN